MFDPWIISDTHFFHKNIIKFSKESFDNIYERNEKIVENWNSVVETGDVVYHLGDVTFARTTEASELLRRLKGKKELIMGNHDNSKFLRPHFAYMHESVTLRKERVVLTHRPLNETDFQLKNGYRNVHGHTHGFLLPSKEHKNVCVEHTDYKPIRLSELIKTWKT